MIPEHYSPTAMFCYHECHRKYYLKYVEKIQVPLSVRLLEGDLFHERIAGASRELVAKLFNERKRHYALPAKDSELSSHAIEFANPGVRQGCSLDGQLRPGSDEARAGGWTGSVLKVLQKAAGHGKPLG